MAKNHFNLQPSEAAIFQAAAQIYAAYIATGQLEEGQQHEWMRRSLHEAITLARATDDAVISDDEVDASEAQRMGEISVGRIKSVRTRHSE